MIGHPSQELEFIDRVYANTKSDLIQITDDKLKNILKDFISKVKKLNDWVVPFSIALTLLLTFLTTEFSKDFMNISKTTWSGIFKIAFFGSIIWLIISAVNSLIQKKKTNIQYLLDEIKNKN